MSTPNEIARDPLNDLSRLWTTLRQLGLDRCPPPMIPDNESTDVEHLDGFLFIGFWQAVRD